MRSNRPVGCICPVASAAMTGVGLYATEGEPRTYELPNGWKPVSQDALSQALENALAAWDGREVQRVAAYYDPESNYAGNLLTAIPPGSSDDVDAADLFAVSS